MLLPGGHNIKVLILLGYGVRMWSQSEVCTLYNAKYPENHIPQATPTKIVHKFEEHGTVKERLARSGRLHVLNEDKKIYHWFLKTQRYHKHKAYFVQE